MSTAGPSALPGLPALTRDTVRPGWTPMPAVALLILATVLLMRSFSKHARKAREPWPGEKDDDAPE